MTGLSVPTSCPTISLTVDNSARRWTSEDIRSRCRRMCHLGNITRRLLSDDVT
jgi:hypothetical protein